MSYRNPKIIIDRSGEVWGKAIADFGRSFAQGMTNFAEIHAKGAAITAKRKESNQLALNLSELKTNEKINKFVKTLPDNSLSKQVKETLMQMSTTGEGNSVIVDGKQYTESVVKAEALLNSNPNLPKNTREAYLKIVNGFQNYIDTSSKNAASVTVNNSELKPDEPGMISKNFDILGEGGEGSNNLLTAMAVNDQQAPGVTYDKNIERPLNKETGEYENILVINNRIKKDSVLYKSWEKNGLTTNGTINLEGGESTFKNSFTEELDENGKPTGWMKGTEYRRNLDKLGPNGLGLIVKIPPQGDPNKALREAGYLKKDSQQESGEGFVADKIMNTRTIEGFGVVDVAEKHFDAQNLENNKTIQAAYKAEAEKIVRGMPLDQQIKYMSNNLMWGQIQEAGWAEMVPKDRMALIEKTLMDRDLTKLMGIGKDKPMKTREAKQSDIDLYAADGKTIELGETIYFTEQISKAAVAQGPTPAETRAQRKENERLSENESSINDATEKGNSIITDTNSSLKNMNFGGGDKSSIYDSKISEDGKLSISYYTGTTKIKNGEKSRDRNSATFDLSNDNELQTLALELYPGKGNIKNREAFKKSIRKELKSFKPKASGAKQLTEKQRLQQTMQDIKATRNKDGSPKEATQTPKFRWNPETREKELYYDN